MERGIKDNVGDKETLKAWQLQGNNYSIFLLEGRDYNLGQFSPSNIPLLLRVDDNDPRLTHPIAPLQLPASGPPRSLQGYSFTHAGTNHVPQRVEFASSRRLGLPRRRLVSRPVCCSPYYRPARLCRGMFL